MSSMVPMSSMVLESKAPNPMDLLTSQLSTTVFEFVEAASEVWPECNVLKAKLAEANSAKSSQELSRVYIKNLHNAMMAKPEILDRLMAKDATALNEDIPLFQELNAYGKLMAAPQEVQDTCWEYIEKIVQSANLSSVYTSAPQEIMDKVALVAEGFVSQIEAGTFDPSTINPAELTKKMMEGLDPDAISKWAATAMNPASIGSIMGVMKNVMGKDGVNMDMASLLGGAMQGGDLQDMEAMKGIMGGLFNNLKKK